jgi:hypothetical protein
MHHVAVFLPLQFPSAVLLFIPHTILQWTSFELYICCSSMTLCFFESCNSSYNVQYRLFIFPISNFCVASLFHFSPLVQLVKTWIFRLFNLQESWLYFLHLKEKLILADPVKCKGIYNSDTPYDNRRDYLQLFKGMWLWWTHKIDLTLWSVESSSFSALRSLLVSSMLPSFDGSDWGHGSWRLL